MPRNTNSMEYDHTPGEDEDDNKTFAAFSDDEDDDTPYDAFKKASAEEEDEDDIDGAVEIDLEPPKKGKKAQAADEDDEDEIEVVKEVPGSAKRDAAAADEDDDEISAEEMESFSDKVQSRIRKKTRLQRAAERRADRKAAEADEAIRLVQLLQAQNQQMRQLITNGETQYVAAAKAAGTAALASAQAKLRQALSDGDADKIIEAQTELARATAAASAADQYRAVAPEIERDVGVIDARVKDFNTKRQTQEFEPDPAAKRWMNRNEWFNKDQRMRSYAIEYAKELESDGYDPIADAKDYYKEIDKEMRKRFPEKFSDEEDETPQRRAAKPQGKRPVAPARSSGPVAKNGKIRVTESMVRTAQRLGLSVADYAREYAKTYPKG